MSFGFRRIPVYIKLYSDEIEIINLESEKRISRKATQLFSSPRIVLSDFHKARQLMHEVLNELSISRNIFFPGLKAVIQQMEKMDGGLAEIEKRAMRDLAEVCGANIVVVVDHDKELNIRQALDLLNGEK